MKKIILTLLLSVILCSLYAQNKAGGNVNSKEPIAYADKEFLTGILDYDSLKNTPAPQNWPEPLNNTFKFTYVTGECRMIPSQFLFDAAKKLGGYIGDKWEEASREVEEQMDKITTALENAWEQVKAGVEKMGESVESGVEYIIHVINQLISVVAGVDLAVKKIFKGDFTLVE